MSSSDVIVLSLVRTDPAIKRWQYVLRAGERIILGKLPTSDLFLDDYGLSRAHACFEAARDARGALVVTVSDLSSLGTCIRRRKVENYERLTPAQAQVSPTVLHNHDSLMMPHTLPPDSPALPGSRCELRVIIFNPDSGCLPDPFDCRKPHSGRWIYHAKLGTGCMGVVYKASDASKKIAEDVAIKVMRRQHEKTVKPKPGETEEQSEKKRFKIFRQHLFIFHREAQLSIKYLHNELHPRYLPESAALIARCIEDNTGFAPVEEVNFAQPNLTYEDVAYNFETYSQPTAFPELPYLVMEFVPGVTLNVHLNDYYIRFADQDAIRPLGLRLAILSKVVKAVHYLASFSFIHRDIRPINIMIDEAKLDQKTNVSLKVIDLGHMLYAAESKVKNRSSVVRVSWKEDMDWAPPEVREEDALLKGINFSMPPHTFDVYSLAILTIQLHCMNDRDKAVALVDQIKAGCYSGSILGQLDFKGILAQMLGASRHRPNPAYILNFMDQRGSKMPGLTNARSVSRGDSDFRLSQRDMEELLQSKDLPEEEPDNDDPIEPLVDSDDPDEPQIDAAIGGSYTLVPNRQQPNPIEKSVYRDPTLPRSRSPIGSLQSRARTAAGRAGIQTADPLQSMPNARASRSRSPKMRLGLADGTPQQSTAPRVFARAPHHMPAGAARGSAADAMQHGSTSQPRERPALEVAAAPNRTRGGREILNTGACSLTSDHTWTSGAFRSRQLLLPELSPRQCESEQR